MRCATIRHEGRTVAVRVEDGVVHPLPFADVRELLDAAVPEATAAPGLREELGVAEVDWAPVVVRPDKIICVGLNFVSHIEEMGREVPEYPALFSKFSGALAGARDPIVLPAVSERVDWEAELALVIGCRTRNVTPPDARQAIAGFTVLNDISMRDYQHRTTQWLQGKTFEASTPIGPVLVPGDEIDWAADLVVTCSVDGEKVQELRTRDMLFGPTQLVSYISRIITLEPGDVISMGTGAGVGAGRIPPRFLNPGQVVETEIEGIGALVNECVAEAT